MRSSDWSSVGCSSVLSALAAKAADSTAPLAHRGNGYRCDRADNCKLWFDLASYCAFLGSAGGGKYQQHSGARDPASRTLFLARLYLSCFGAARPGGVGEPLAGESDRRSIRWTSPLRLYPDRGTGDSPEIRRAEC